MSFDQTRSVQYLRTLLILGRASNLPTVWSNCLAGWLLGGGGSLDRFWLLALGATTLYLGGMFLNDAFDAQFDQQHRPERPIPSGAILAPTVWKWGLSWLVVGWLVLAYLGPTTATLAALLVINILVYDAIHKLFAFSPIVMAACRFFLILVAASVGDDGVTGGGGLSVWSAFALASYVVGLSFLARKESMSVPVRLWPCLIMLAPLLLGLIVNQGAFQARNLFLSALLLVWVLSSLRHLLSPEPNIPRCVSALLAGIVLVDLLAVGGATFGVGLVFFALFVLTLLAQQFIPAT